MLDLQLSKNDDRPFYLQIAEALRYLIVNGSLRAGEKLPAVRKLADQLGINPATVVAAYRILNKEGLIAQRHGSGAYIKPHSSITEHEGSEFVRRDEHHGCDGVVNFASNVPPGHLFPIASIKKIINEILDEEGAEVFQYQDAEGFEPLRSVWVDEYTKTWHHPVSLTNISVVSGAQQGIDLAVRLLIKRGDSVLMESPGYRGARDVLLANGASIIPVPVETDGIALQYVEKICKQKNVRAIYINPVLHNPTTAVWSTSNCTKLIELSRKYDFFIIEDDQFSDLLEEPVLPLAGLDAYRVIYIKSYSKVLFPGLRVASLYVPKLFFERLVAMKRTSDIASNGLMQRVLHRLIISSEYTKHTVNSRKYYATILNKFNTFINENASLKLEWNMPQGGFNAWIKLPQKVTATTLAQNTAAQGLFISPEKMFRNEGKITSDSHVRLSIGSVDEASYQKGIACFERCLKDLL